MTSLVDTSVLIDCLRGDSRALDVLTSARGAGRLHASEITRLEVLAGMRPTEEARTRTLLTALHWHPVDEDVAERAGRLGRQWLPSHGGIDGADLAIAATAELLQARLLTTNLRHFPMFPELQLPY